VWNVQRVDEDGNESNDRQEPFSVAFMPDGDSTSSRRLGIVRRQASANFASSLNSHQ